MKEARYSLIPPEALELIAIHYGRGAKKYAEHNWRKGYEWSKSYDALQRHLASWLMGEDIDEETQSPHLAAAAFHINTLLVFGKEFPEFDDRFKVLIEQGDENLDQLREQLTSDGPDYMGMEAIPVSQN